MIDPQPDFNPAPGVAETIVPGVRRLLANNPSPMTFRGTNTYLVGGTDVAVIDPGPNDTAHLEAILAATASQKIMAILVTHSHLDHSPLARTLADRSGAPIYAFSDSFGGRSAIMQQLDFHGLAGGGEGVDATFSPDICLADGEAVSGSDWALRALHTPGHFGNHLSFAFGDTLFCGDLVMGWASSLVSPPDGDLTDFMASCRRLRTGSWRTLLPGHGAAIDDPHGRIDWLIRHRQSREAAVLEALAQGPATSTGLAKTIYTDTPAALLPAAARNVFAHLIDLFGQSRVKPDGDLHFNATFQRCR